VNKSNLKVFIIQSIDRQMDFSDIADAKNIDMNTLLNEIEAIVNSGTKINIDYYLNSVMDNEHQQDIYDYFMEEAENESLENALQELGEDNYSEEEVRLVRIKFMSELGN
jgi:ATP-dependent DNA helicase RecQ